jgi:hypothetical protein
MRIMTALTLALLGATGVTACTQDVRALEAQQIEQQYGVAGAYPGTVATPDGALAGTLVPITLANGRQGHLFIPQQRASAPDAVYLRDEQGLHPVRLGDNVSREDLARSPAIVERRAAPPQQAKTRSWEKEVLIVGGSAGAGGAIGALAGGKKGAAVGAAAGGVGGLIYDLLTRNKK